MNILVIVADDMRYELVEYMPFLSGTIRAEGTSFPNARLNVPICQPTRIGFLTGQYGKGALNGVYQNTGGMGQVLTDSIGIWLQAEGVTTGMFGKCPNDYRQAAARPGWDTWNIFVANEQEPFDYTISDGVSASSPGEHQVTYLPKRLNDFVTNATEPWFAWYNPTNPHITNQRFQNNPVPSSISRYTWKKWELELLQDDELSNKPSWIASKDQLTVAEQTEIRHAIRQQLREVYDLDQSLQTIYNDLQTAGVLDDTLIIFTADNGVFYGEMRDHHTATASKDAPYDPAVRVPMILRGPGVPVGGTNLTPVNIQDITATALAAYGAAGVNPDGHDLLDYIQNPDLDRAILYERRDSSDADEPDGSGVFTRTQKLIRWTEADGVAVDPADEYEAYDIDTDPHEKINWAYDGGRSAERDALEALLDDLLGI